MQGAAMGLTCRDALAVFSANESLALQRRVSELEEELAEFKPRYTFQDKKVHARALVVRIKARFNVIHPRETRHKPVRDESDALTPLASANGCIWSGFGSSFEHEDHSLLGIVMEELVSALGDSCRTYCDTHCGNIRLVLAQALRAGYTGGGWINFGEQERQECIVWIALRSYLGDLP